MEVKLSLWRLSWVCGRKIGFVVIKLGLVFGSKVWLRRLYLPVDWLEYVDGINLKLLMRIKKY